jgi:predicted transposase YdaD
MTISKDEVERARLESEHKYEVDTQSKVVHAKREGKREVAQKALAKGSTPEFVADITGLSLDEIRRL